jgi:glycerol-3-phosphate acyltransferase PlsY
MGSLFIIIAMSYVLGSIPSSIILGKLFKHIDIREHGSGNAGATNAFRVLGWKIALVVLILDISKGAVATVFISKLTFFGETQILSQDYLMIICGFAAIFGHIWTLFAKFNGGKGVATAAGMLIGLYPLATGIALVLFGIIAYATRYISVASMISAVSVPIILLILKYTYNEEQSLVLFVFSIVLSVLIIFTHRTNIQRLMKGEEKKIGEKV